jgi:hypothetical protein
VWVYKVRLSEAGVHLFDRVSGLNVLLDEIEVPAGQVSRAPRYLSVALTNTCELRCTYCYAPKYPAGLDVNQVVAWAIELDRAGCLGVGFGGGGADRLPSVCPALRADRRVDVDGGDLHDARTPAHP